MNKPRKQTYTMEMYLNKIKEKDVRSDADTQRLVGQWTEAQINELVFTVLSEDYIPPIILGEETNSQTWIIDGLQRSSSLQKFRSGHHKITSAIENPIVHYRAKKKDSKGKIVEDGNGNIIWDDIEYNIKGKRYDDLPVELKQRFNEYQIETVIHEECDMKRVSVLVKRYNNQTPMNAAQKAFTYIEKYAREVRSIIDLDFFQKYCFFSEKDFTKGNIERVVMETIMCMNHMDSWKKTPKAIASYLNEKSEKEEYQKLFKNVERLSKIVNENMSSVFTIKDTFIWLTLFDRFSEIGIGDEKFADFINEFMCNLKNKEVDGQTFVNADKGKGTKDKKAVLEKLHILETLIYNFLGLNKSDYDEIDCNEFLNDISGEEIPKDDVDFYKELLGDLTVEVDNSSRLLKERNLPSLLGIVWHATTTDIDLDSWIVDFFNRNSTYIANQKKNYEYMKEDLENYLKEVV